MAQKEHLSDIAKERIDQLENELARLDQRESEVLDEIARIKEADIPDYI